MEPIENKKELVKRLTFLHNEIVKASRDSSRATLDYKVKKRQTLIVELVEGYKLELNEEDIVFLESIKVHSSQLLKEVETEKHNRVIEIIKRKSSKTRVNLYTSIAKHK